MGGDGRSGVQLPAHAQYLHVPARGRSSSASGSAAQVGTARMRGSDSGLALPVKVPETMVSLATLESNMDSNGKLEEGAKVTPPQFEVELDVGGGRVASISVQEHANLEEVAMGVAREHNLAELDQRRIAAYLQRLRQEVTAAARPAGIPQEAAILFEK